MKCLVLILNRCQPAYLGCYGNDWLATPALDRLAAQSVVFDQHFVDDLGPDAARLSWSTGRYRVAPDAGAVELPRLFWEKSIPAAFLGDERSPTFASLMASSWEWQRWLRRQQLAELEQESLLGGAVQTAIEWLQEFGAREHWLLWLEIGALQPPWDQADFDAEAILAEIDQPFEPWLAPPLGPISSEKDVERLQNTYGGLVGGLDQWLGMLLDFLKETGLAEQTLLLLTSDCGLPLGEHGHFGDHPWLYEEAVHLPLLVRWPGSASAGRRVQHLTQPVDLLPTLAEAFGLSLPGPMPGRSLLALARGESIKQRDYTCSWSAEEGAIRTHQWYLIVPQSRTAEPQRRPQLYLKPEDRWEVNNVISQHPEVAEHLELTLRRFVAAMTTDRRAELPELRKDVLNIVQ